MRLRHAQLPFAHLWLPASCGEYFLYKTGFLSVVRIIMLRLFNYMAHASSPAPPELLLYMYVSQHTLDTGVAKAQVPSAGSAAFRTGARPCLHVLETYLFWKAVWWSVRTTPGMCRARRKRWKEDGGRGCEYPTSCKLTFAPTLLLLRIFSKFLTWKKREKGTVPLFFWIYIFSGKVNILIISSMLKIPQYFG